MFIIIIYSPSQNIQESYSFFSLLERRPQKTTGLMGEATSNVTYIYKWVLRMCGLANSRLF